MLELIDQVFRHGLIKPLDLLLGRRLGDQTLDGGVNFDILIEQLLGTGHDPHRQGNVALNCRAQLEPKSLSCLRMAITYQWRGDFDSADVEELHAEGFGHKPEVYEWKTQVEDHSLGWVCAREGETLIGFVNVAWDGAGHAFILDTLVSESARRRGVGQQLVAVAVENARIAGCEWLHVDFDDHLQKFYLDACGFRPTNAGLIAL
jgi:GNAT superfamily N-acetyltransferase